MSKYKIESAFKEIPESGSYVAEGSYSHGGDCSKILGFRILKSIDTKGTPPTRVVKGKYTNCQLTIAVNIASAPLSELFFLSLTPDPSRLTHGNKWASYSLHESDTRAIKKFFLAMNEFDPFDDEIKIEIHRALGISFDLTEDELNELISTQGIEATMLQIQQQNPDSSFLLAELYNARTHAQAPIVEADLRTCIKCYALVAKTDSNYTRANENILTLIMSLQLEYFSKETQAYLRMERVKALINLGQDQEASFFFASAYGLSLDKLGLLSLAADPNVTLDHMAVYMRSLHELIAKLEMENASLKSAGSTSGVVDLGLFAGAAEAGSADVSSELAAVNRG